MRIREIIPEASPDTPGGSVSTDLMQSKLWLCRSLLDLNLAQFDRIYILGSWYGALALIMRRLPFDYSRIICVDQDHEKSRYLRDLVRRHEFTDIYSRCLPVENLIYRGSQILVINTSTNDMTGNDWMQPIPSGAVVAAQGRSNQARSNGVETLEHFDQAYPMQHTLKLAEITVTGVDGQDYQRFMKIGIC